jgi:nitrite reductase/ring-hydroxylating ferredoxin subunit
VSKSELSANTWGGTVNGKYIALYITPGGEVYATQGYCTHEACMLNFGYFDGEQIECSCHGGRFSVRTGQVTFPPPDIDLLVYTVEVRGDDIYVDL